MAKILLEGEVEAENLTYQINKLQYRYVVTLFSTDDAKDNIDG